MDQIELGRTYRDRIPGFQGVATGPTRYLTDCSQVLLAPPVGENGEYKEPHWYDQQRLESVDAPMISRDNSLTPGPDTPAPKR